jgi:hypothetical protein
VCARAFRQNAVSPQFNCRGWVLLHSGSIRARRHACLSHVLIERLRVSRRRMLGSEVAATLVARSVRVRITPIFETSRFQRARTRMIIDLRVHLRSVEARIDGARRRCMR